MIEITDKQEEEIEEIVNTAIKAYLETATEYYQGIMIGAVLVAEKVFSKDYIDAILKTAKEEVNCDLQRT